MFDRYSNPQDYSESDAERREKLKTKFRFNQQFMPIDGESIKVWIQRTELLTRQLEDFSTEKHVFGKKGAWFTHWSASSCFMCDQSTACRFYALILDELIKREPKLSPYCWQYNVKEQSWTVRTEKS